MKMFYAVLLLACSSSFCFAKQKSSRLGMNNWQKTERTHCPLAMEDGEL
jgi:hypothetical protein